MGAFVFTGCLVSITVAKVVLFIGIYVVVENDAGDVVL